MIDFFLGSSVWESLTTAGMAWTAGGIQLVCIRDRLRSAQTDEQLAGATGPGPGSVGSQALEVGAPILFLLPLRARVAYGWSTKR